MFGRKLSLSTVLLPLIATITIVFLGFTNVAVSQEEGFDLNIEPTEMNEVLQAASEEQGLDILRSVMDRSSRETDSSEIREIVVSPPGEIPNVEGLDYVRELPSIVAIAVYHQVVNSPEMVDEAALEGFGRRGQRARLSSGGVLYLRVNSDTSPTSATIAISGTRVPGYEEVREMRFVLVE